MNAAALDLQEAVFTALKGHGALVTMLGGPKVHDLTPAGLAFPYVTFGRADVYDWSTDLDEGSEVLFTLHVWSKHRGRKELLHLMQHVGEALGGDAVALSGHYLVHLRLETTEIRHDEDLDVFEGAMHFRAVMEPA
jgi:hypothetical protein